LKPIRLTFQAFGPFVKKQSLDFTLLGNRSFFLINGPTGSGKTTILDAISFALYGETSGNERQGTSMRSDHAPASLQTEVTFEFTLGDRMYRVTRIPEQTRTKRRGSGTTRQVASATLWQLPESHQDENEIVLADRWSRVTEKIEHLLGFKSDQFRQVIMLPQGQFRRFLAASSSERQELLAVLFKTSRYRYIENALKDSTKTIKETYGRYANQKHFILQQADVENVHSLQEKAAELQEKIATESAHLQKRRLEENDAQEKWNEAVAVKNKFFEQDEAKAEFDKLEDKKDSFLHKEQLLKRAREADMIRERWEALDRVRSEQHLAENQLHQANNSLQSAMKRKKKAESDAADTETKIEQRNQLHLEIHRLHESKKNVTALDREQNEFIKLTSERSELEQELTEQSNQLQQLHELSAKTIKELETAKEQAQLRPLREKEVHEITSALETLQRFVQLKKENETNRKLLENYSDAFKEAQNNVHKARMQLHETEEHHRTEQAGLMASKLSPGTPCPVCGSTTHPHLAPFDGSVPEEDDLIILRSHVEKMEHLLELSRARLDEQKEQYTKGQNEFDIIKKQLGDNSESNRPVLEERLKVLSFSLQQTENSKVKCETLRNEIERVKNQIAVLEREITVKKQHLSTVSETSGAHKKHMIHLEHAIGSRPKTIGGVEQSIQEAERNYKAMCITIEQIHNELHSAREAFSACQATWNASNKATEDAAQRYNESIKVFGQALTETVFETEEQFRECLLAKTKIEQLDQEVRAYHTHFHAALKRLQRAQTVCEQYTMPNMDDLENALKETRSTIETVSTSLGTHNAELARVSRWIEECEMLDRNMEEYGSKYRIYGSIAQVASGDNILRMTYERFVLASLLDEVLTAGSHRLRMMSRGRFDLQRMREPGDMRTAGGLELQIYDAYTGTCRPVHSLSGGESFLASLSLALGLSDIVQSFAGGIHLETIFVDEGFGSLDNEALDLAFQALADLGLGGRLVGIISHVPDLRERIDVRLEVKGEKYGSSAVFVV